MNGENTTVEVGDKFKQSTGHVITVTSVRYGSGTKWVQTEYYGGRSCGEWHAEDLLELERVDA